MEQSLMKKEHTVTVLKEKLRHRHESWQRALQTLEREKSRAGSLEENIQCLHNTLNEIYKTESCLKDSCLALTEATQRRRSMIEAEVAERIQAGLQFEKEVSQMCNEISNGCELYNESLVEVEVHESTVANQTINDETKRFNDLSIKYNNIYSQLAADCHRQNLIYAVINILLDKKKSEYEKVLENNDKEMEEVSLLRLEQQQLQLDIQQLNHKLQTLQTNL